MEYGIADILELIGALGLFLFGMKFMSDALLDLAGDRMRSILSRMTSNRFKGVFIGFLITASIQSSSATTLMVVSFANAALLSLPQAIGVIMGANIGTTVTAWLITLLGFKVSMGSIALPLVGLGLAITFAKRQGWKHFGHFVIGFALLFLGLDFLKEAVPDIQQNPGILSFLEGYADMGFGSVLLFLLIGTLLTMILQSSSATMAITLLMTAKGWIPFELAAAMILGENIGTTITANIAAFMGNFHARRTALAHLLFNVFGVLWMLAAFYPFLKAVAWAGQQMGGASPYLSAAAVPAGVSLFHTTFNVVNTLLLVWWVKPIAQLVRWWVPEKPEKEKAMEEPKYLSEEALGYPETAVAALEQETRYLFEHAVFEIVAHAVHLHREDIFSDRKSRKVVRDSRKDLKVNVRELYLTKVKRIYSQIIAFATRAQSELELSGELHRRVGQIKWANRTMVETIKEAQELHRNASRYLSGTHPVMQREYDTFRKRVVKVLRAIRELAASEDQESSDARMDRLATEARKGAEEGHLSLDHLIREQEITPEMASSLFNDYDYLNDLIQKLIAVARWLYRNADPDPGRD